MKYFVAPTMAQIGRGKLDFCWTTPDEPVTIGFKCDSGTPGDRCGCRRAVSGIISKKATTVAVVVDRDWTVERIADMGKGDTSIEDVETFARMALPFNVGERVGFIFTDTDVGIFKAGHRKDWGV